MPLVPSVLVAPSGGASCAASPRTAAGLIVSFSLSHLTMRRRLTMRRQRHNGTDGTDGTEGALNARRCQVLDDCVGCGG
jgi:hypothetical protein